MASLNVLANELKIRSDRSEIWNHPYFRLQPSAKLIRNWLLQAGPFEEQYPRFLRDMLANPNIPPSCHPVIQENLDDELGNGNPSAAHFELFKQTLQAAGVSLSEYNQATRNPSTSKMLDLVLSVCSGDDPIAALSFIAQVELFTPGEYSRIINWFNNVLPRSSGQWEPYFSVHIGCDEHHFAELARVLEKIVSENPDKKQSAFEWQATGLGLDIGFYDELYRQAIS